MKTVDPAKLLSLVARAVLDSEGTLSLDALPASASALLALALAREKAGVVLWVCPGVDTLETLHQDMMTLAPAWKEKVAFFPPRDERGDDGWNRRDRSRRTDHEATGFRVDTLQRLSTAKPPDIVVTCVPALGQAVPSATTLKGHVLVLKSGEDVGDVDELRRSLIDRGYAMQDEVQDRGDLAVRGGLMDIWPATEDYPLRVEWVGATVESIRSFDPATQRSTGLKDRAELTPIRETEESATLMDHLGARAIIVWAEAPPLLYPLKTEWKVVHLGSAAVDIGAGARVDCDIQPCPSMVSTTDDPLLPDFMEEARRRLLDELGAHAKRGRRVWVYCDSTGSRDHVATLLGDSTIDLRVGVLSEGFSSDSLKLTILAESDLYARRKRLGRRYDPRGGTGRATFARPLDDLSEIQPGDYVVHVDHGIAKYLGLTEIDFNGQRQEVMTLEYADEMKLHVPAAHVHLLSRYVPVSRHRVRLHRLGGKRWNEERAGAEKAIEDMAASLLETQAARSLEQGFAFPADTAWQREFEASFPYVDTPDQTSAVSELKREMESPRIMDRLICGDAGYGKTEVAMRAAFKAVMAGRQVAVLVPTTVLAQQHFDSFRERMAAYPVRIEMASRFRSHGQLASTLRALAEGAVDIIIGTHSLLHPHVRFRELGLVIIDEEQRFGVAHKEYFKRMRASVDVLTLSATPIPRTLYMSMVGIRDMSLLQTPPRERQQVETVVTEWSNKTVREAILHELQREGQVFYVHNRVMTIDLMLERLAALVPEARIRIGHGQMPTGELAEIMKAFVDGEFDVLLCTVIIESGVDIPRANTILIDRADRFGIADLYQLRGRVGRSNRKGYAYLLLPAHGDVDSDVRRRIKAIKQYSEAGSSYRLALQDLELRGAGNLLGVQQSGYINAIGFGLYCQLLRRSVSMRKGERVAPPAEVSLRLDFLHFAGDTREPERCAFLPHDYVEDERHRIVVYRRMAEALHPRDVQALREELVDRFGPIPAPAERLLLVAELRVLAGVKGLSALETQNERVTMLRDGVYLKTGQVFPRLKSKSAGERLTELIHLVETVDRWSHH